MPKKLFFCSFEIIKKKIKFPFFFLISQAIHSEEDTFVIALFCFEMIEKWLGSIENR